MDARLIIGKIELEYEVWDDVPTIPGYLTTAEAAERLNVTPGRIRQLIANEELPSIKIGGANLIPEAAFEQYERGGRRKRGWPKGKSRKTGGKT